MDGWLGEWAMGLEGKGLGGEELKGGIGEELGRN